MKINKYIRIILFLNILISMSLPTISQGLKGKIISTSGVRVAHVPAWREQLTSALSSLGFTARDADNAVGKLVIAMQESGEDPSNTEMGELLKRALQSGSRGRS